MIRPYLRDLINHHKTSMESNDNNSNSNNNNTDRAEWKIQLVMQNNFISVKNLKILALYILQVSQQRFLWVVTQKMLLINFLIQFQKEFNK